MPLEVNEIGIRMRVGDSAPPNAERAPNASGGPAKDPCCQDGDETKNEQLILDCVRRVLEIIESDRER